jgi:hypothetical protein
MILFLRYVNLTSDVFILVWYILGMIMFWRAIKLPGASPVSHGLFYMMAGLTTRQVTSLYQPAARIMNLPHQELSILLLSIFGRLWLIVALILFTLALLAPEFKELIRRWLDKDS